MTLNQYMKEILLHRLESGTIPEVLADSEPGEGFTPLHEAEAATASVTAFVKAGSIPFHALTEAQRWVLIDCLEGSTIFADWQDNLHGGWDSTPKGHYLSLFNAASLLEKEFSRQFNRKVSCCRS